MKHGRNPSRAEKKVLTKNKKDWTEWLFVEAKINAQDKQVIDMTFVHRDTNEVLCLKTHK